MALSVLANILKIQNYTDVKKFNNMLEINI